MTDETLSAKIKQIVDISSIRNNTRQVIDDMMQLCFNLLGTNVFDPLNMQYEKIIANDEAMVELTDYKRDLKAWEVLQEAATLYIKQVKESPPFSDVIGAEYDKNLNFAKGQFLTPDSLSYKLMPFLGQDKIDSAGELHGEPTVGAGTMMLANIRKLLKINDKEDLKKLHIVCNDIDMNMCRMASNQVLISSLVHSIPLGSFIMINSDVIKEYLNGGELVITAIHDVEQHETFMKSSKQITN